MKENLFAIQRDIMQDYRGYIESFLNIDNEDLANFVKAKFDDGSFWKKPLIQFNPSYELLGPIEKSLTSSTINPTLKEIVYFSLYKHQVEAIKLGIENKDFVVTSGTGSGKSITYLTTIFNYILNNRQDGVINAVIVYPMNALINSQEQEINNLKERYKEKTGKQFPITFNKYTGQESKAEREMITKNPPHIILTNYMMLELILTRPREKSIRDNIYNNIKYLVFDELHTYRGRQGADVALLIRRIIHSAKSNNIVCIGTSATMASGETIDDKNEIVAKFASKIFGKTITDQQIVNEYLEKSFVADSNNKTKLLNFLESSDYIADTNIMKHPLGIWLEDNIALAKEDGFLIRNKPFTMEEITAELAKYSGVDENICSAKLEEFLVKLSNFNSEPNQQKQLLPYKIHQFIAQTGLVHSYLDLSEPTLEPLRQRDSLPIFPIVFSRFSGKEFFCVRLDTSEQKLIPREFEDNEEIEGQQAGYLIPFTHEITREAIDSMIPESWQNILKSGNYSIRKDRKKHIPQDINYNKDGFYSLKEEMQLTGLFLPWGFLLDPTSGNVYDARTSEMTKLSKLGSEGRSTSTTILTYSILNNLDKIKGISEAEKKLLSFTDNRQDASLQAGHFNDFYFVVRLRSAIYEALRKKRLLDYTNIDNEVFQSLNLSLFEVTGIEGDSQDLGEQVEEALKIFIMYKLLYDLRRSWRVVLPNLEQCGLLKISYRGIDQVCEKNDVWEDPLFWNHFDVEERKTITYHILDFFRKSYAICDETFLTKESITRNSRIMRDRLKISPWSLDREEEIQEPNLIYIQTIKGRNRREYISAGFRSRFAQYLIGLLKDKGVSLEKDNYEAVIYNTFDLFEREGWLESQPSKNMEGERTKTYRLKISAIIWEHADEDFYNLDIVQHNKIIDRRTKVNSFFKKLYRNKLTTQKSHLASEHTGQIDNEKRQDRENKFRSGEISALYCSPTMELGIDIATLNVVHMRNVPPNPANYAQRSGRAGRSGSAALVFTSCSNFSPHDRHYYRNSVDMVAGKVQVPNIELNNRDMLKSHLHAMLIAKSNFNLGNNLLDLYVPDKELSFELTPDIQNKLQISEVNKREIVEQFQKLIADFVDDEMNISKDWIIATVDNFKNEFIKALSRWENMWKSIKEQIVKNNEIIRSATYSKQSPPHLEAMKNNYLALRQLEVLRNEDRNNTFSEFYPYRYLASEGFLPGYNFTRLPLRTFISKGSEGYYLSRPRAIALREFGPGNMIYNNGDKYKIKKISMLDISSNLQQVKISTTSGYLFKDDSISKNNCPITNETLEPENIEVIGNLLEAGETYAELTQRISCEEEIRTSQGYYIKCYFSNPERSDAVKEISIKKDEETLIKMHFIPTANLYYINHRWIRSSDEEGFVLDLDSGLWKSRADNIANQQLEDNQKNLKTVKLFTNITTDALYIQPLEALALSQTGIITLQYALKKAIENYFHAESDEIGSTLMGDAEKSNILIYEASEGSLGILSRFSKDASVFSKVIEEAIKVCRFAEDTGVPATYDDLLSYYNQRHHDKIDRYEIKDTLELLMMCKPEIKTNVLYSSYENHYNHLLKHLDQDSATELKFIEYLYKHGLKLPDTAQPKIEGVYCVPDFYYNESNTVVFCDGTPHDQEAVKERDREQRSALRNMGYNIVVYYYMDKLEDVVAKRPDIFYPVKDLRT